MNPMYQQMQGAGMDPQAAQQQQMQQYLEWAKQNGQHPQGGGGQGSAMASTAMKAAMMAAMMG